MLKKTPWATQMRSWHRLRICGGAASTKARAAPASKTDAPLSLGIKHNINAFAARRVCIYHTQQGNNRFYCTNRHFLGKFDNDNSPKVQHHWGLQQRCFAHDTKDMTNMTSQEMASLQTELLNEASYLTRILYRKCLQSVKLLSEGNARDEDDFSEREMKERNEFNDNASVDLERVSMAPPVNRENELDSRANYYKSFTREHFDGHWNLLGKHGFHIGDEGSMRHGLGGFTQQNQQMNQYQGGHHHLGGQMSPQQYHSGKNDDSSAQHNGDARYYQWREEQIEQFVYLIKSGEEKRQWILSDYEFEDPFKPSNSDAAQSWAQELEDRLHKFEVESNSLVREMYRRKGWMHSTGYENAGSDDDFFSDSDSDDDL
mmetsp:Transcript_1342/g.2513  ORF Transcript_1342/g.2513 Transcript_1342/m.2513 type:complete len:373 (-) Transcript_1342:234-1352(-)